jgi:hypothetical protein
LSDDQNHEPKPEDISDEILRKYDPERLLRVIGKRAGKGESLDHSVRAKYEKRFGVDLGHVRVFTGEFAEEFNKQRNAYAVTLGRTGMILMGGSPEKSMGSTAGQALLAHELTHVAQAQRANPGAGGLHRKSFDGEMPFGAEHSQIEEEAEAEEYSEASSAGLTGTQSSMQAVNEESGRQMSEDQLKKDVEKIKARVLEMAGDAARTQMWRNGNARRA